MTLKEAINLHRRHMIDLTTCENCPFANECEELQLFWGCAVWEDEMGEDL